MKKTLKILGWAVGGLILLLVILALSLAFFIDPNQYRDKIVEIVKTKTGRELRIEDKFSWSFFPWIGIETGGLQLSNAPGFGAEPFAHLDNAGAKVELLPLLRKQIVVDTVFIDGLKLRLARNAAGKSNWDDLTAASKTEKLEKPSEKNKPGEAPAIAGISVNKLDIRKADVTWKDDTSGTSYAVHNLDLKTGKIISAQPVDLQLFFDLESGQPPVRTRVELQSKLNVDLQTQTGEVSNLKLTVGDLTLLANLKARQIFDAPAANGNLEIAAFNPRALMQKLNIKYDNADAKALEKLSLKTNFAYAADSIELKNLAIALDDSRLTGDLAVRHFAKPAYQFDLAVDQIDIDRYLPRAAPPAAASKPAAATPATAPVAVPLSALRALTLQGKLRVQKLKAMNLQSTDATVLLAAADGLITLGPNQAKLYSGKYAGRTSLDVRGKTPLLNIEESVSGIELAPALKDALQFDKFTGTANLSAKVTAQGVDAEQIKQTLNGTANFAVQNGAIQGIDLKKTIDAIAAAVKDRSYQKLTEIKPAPDDQTRFSQSGGSVQIKNGIAQNNDLKIQSPDLLNIGGKGSANLPKASLDYTLMLGSYPLLIDGPFAKLHFRPDWNAIVKGKVEQKVEEKKTQAKEELKNKFQDKLRDRLKLH
ncbi:MAG: AsmA family protein [Gammaproteobacteria bacterium]|nr:AsmA family protein [Gammaproteobacteria bacterium]